VCLGFGVEDSPEAGIGHFNRMQGGVRVRDAEVDDDLREFAPVVAEHLDVAGDEEGVARRGTELDAALHDLGLAAAPGSDGPVDGVGRGLVLRLRRQGRREKKDCDDEGEGTERSFHEHGVLPDSQS
jgi:hypothetical protein